MKHNVEELMESFSDFEEYWDQYKSDLCLRVDACFTEPTCPSATVYFELDRAPLKTVATAWGNSVDEAINNAVAAAKERFIKYKGMTYEETKAAVTEERRILEEERKQRLAKLQDIINDIKFAEPLFEDLK